jgi:hypothetical protein
MNDEPQIAVQELRDNLQSALAKRDYARALLLQESLKKSAAEYEKQRKKQAAEALNAHVEQLERERGDEQVQLESAIDQQISAIRQYFTGLYDQIEQRRAKTSEELDRKFESPAFTVMKISPTIRNLQRAEAFYVKNGDYRSAAQVRRQIQQETRIEVVDFETRTKVTIEAARRDALRQYQAEQKSFTQRLHNERNILIRDVDRQILTIENKYNKLHHNLTKRSEKAIGELADVRTSMHNHIRQSIAAFEAELQRPGEEIQHSEEEQEIKAPPPRAPSARRERPSSVRRPRNPRVDVALARASRRSPRAEDI